MTNFMGELSFGQPDYQKREEYALRVPFSFARWTGGLHP
jgi:hypothetical protein